MTSKKLSEAVKGMDKKNESLTDKLTANTAELVKLLKDEVSLRTIQKGLKEIGVEVSYTHLRLYLLANFPSLYEEKYTSRKPKYIGRPKTKNKEGGSKSKVKPKKESIEKEEGSLVKDKPHIESIINNYMSQKTDNKKDLEK